MECRPAASPRGIKLAGEIALKLRQERIDITSDQRRAIAFMQAKGVVASFVQLTSVEDELAALVVPTRAKVVRLYEKR